MVYIEVIEGAFPGHFSLRALSAQTIFSAISEKVAIQI